MSNLKRITVKEEIVNLVDDLIKAVILQYFIDIYGDIEFAQVKMELTSIKENTMLTNLPIKELKHKIKDLDRMDYLQTDDFKNYFINIDKISNDLLDRGYFLEGYPVQRKVNNIESKKEVKGENQLYKFAVNNGFKKSQSLKALIHTLKIRYKKDHIKMAICECSVRDNYNFGYLESILTTWKEQQTIILHKNNPYYNEKYDKNNNIILDPEKELEELYKKGYK